MKTLSITMLMMLFLACTKSATPPQSPQTVVKIRGYQSDCKCKLIKKFEHVQTFKN